MSKHRDNLSSDEVQGAESVIGKVLIHARKLEQSSGCGFAFCFGDKKDATEGPMIVIRMEEVGGLGPFGGPSKQMAMKFYYSGIWRDKELILN